MEKLENKITKVEIEDYSLAITKGYAYKTKDGKERFAYCDSYFQEGEQIFREHNGSYFKIELQDIVIETFKMKDGGIGSKSYLLSETPYLANSSDEVDPSLLESFLRFKMHR